MRRLREEDVTAQVNNLTDARLVLSAALGDLAEAARRASRAKTPDLPQVYGCMSRVRRAEEDVDTATLDLATARGEDA